ncbi:MAG: 50S ribosomal protein L37ae [Candidatus Thorarchaeota archaeon]|nr:50S ribosomal protein L37ae [Candidatus Thorarchaeota archaeon]
MARLKKVGSTGRLGPRYGAKLRRRMLDLERRKLDPHRCPRCSTVALKRMAAGLWLCRKCDLVFAGGAYTPYTDAGRAARRAIEQRIAGDLITIREQEPVVPEFLPRREIELATIEAQDMKDEENSED